MKFRRDASITLVIAITVVTAAAAFISSQLFSGMTSAVEQNQFQMMQAIVQTALKDTESKALARADMIADLPNVKTLFAARDRPAMVAELSKMFADQKARYGVDQAQFHIPPATSFLRLQDPATFGDDLTAFRPMVVTVNRQQEPLKGAAIARSGPAIFGVTPVFDTAGKAIGSFEMGLDFGPLLASLKSAYSLDLALFIDERGLIDFAKGVDPALMGEQNRVGRYIRFNSTNADLMAELATASDLAVVNEPVTYVRSAQGLERGVVLLPLNNSAGTPLGVIAVSSDFSASRAAVNRSLVWQALIAIISIVLLVGIVLIVLRGFLIRPLQILNDRFEAAGANQPMAPIENSDRFPQELQIFVSMYDRIRSRRNGPDSAP